MNPKYTVALDRRLGSWIYPLHRRVYRLTGGVIGHRSMMGPILLLTTTGRRTRERRTTPLLYMPDADDFVVVASNGGRDRAPAWLLNLEATPKAEVQVRRRKVAVVAGVLRGEVAEQLRPRLAEHYSGWAYYQHLTEREIPVVRLAVAT